MFNPTSLPVCLPSTSLLGTFGWYSFLAASTHTQMRCVWENNELFFCHNSSPKKQRGVMRYESCSSFATNTSVVMKAGSFISGKECRERARERRVCLSVLVAVGVSLLGPASSSANLLHQPSKCRALQSRPSYRSTQHTLSFLHSQFQPIPFFSLLPRVLLAPPPPRSPGKRAWNLQKRSGGERKRRERVRHVGTHVTQVSGAGEGRRLYTVPRHAE